MFSSFRSPCLFFTRWQMTFALCAFALGLAQAQDVDPNPPPLTQNMVKDAFVQALKEFADYGAGEDWRIVTLPTTADDDFTFLNRDLETRIGANVIPYLQLLRALYPEFTVDTIYDSSKGYLGLQFNSQSNFFESALVSFDSLTNKLSQVSENTLFIGSSDFEWYISQLEQLVTDMHDDVRYLSYWDHYNANENGADVWVQNFDELVENLISELHYGTIDFANVIRDTMLGDDTNASTSEAYGQLEDYAEAVDTNLTTAAEIISDPHLDEIQGLVNPENFSSDLSSLLPDAEGLVSSGSLSYTITFTDGLLLFGFDIPQIKVDYSFLMDSDCNFTLFRDAIYFAIFFVWLFRFVLHNITHLASLGQSQRVS